MGIKCKKGENKHSILSPERSWARSGDGTAPPPAPLPLLSFPSSQPLEPKTSPAPVSPWTGRPTPSASWPSASPTQAASSPSSLQWRWIGSQRTGHGHVGQLSSSKASYVWHSPGGVWGGGTGHEVAGSAGSPRGATAGSWSALRWSEGQSGPTQRKHCGCCGKPAWSCWGWSPRPGCRARGWYQKGKKGGEEAHALLSTRKSSCHFAVEEAEEGGEKWK